MSAIGPDIFIALEYANKALDSAEYTVELAKPIESEHNDPVFLELVYADGTKRNIGITHHRHLTDTPDDFRTDDELGQAITRRVQLFIESEGKGLLINNRGSIYDFGAVDVKVLENGTFTVNGTLVTTNDKPLLLESIMSESVITFTQVGSELVQLVDPLDRRTGKGMFIRGDGVLTRG